MDEADRTTVKDATHKVVLYLQLGALITGALAVAVAAIFGVRAEKEKNLGLHYLSLRPLISIYTKSSETLQIKYENAVVKQPGLLSARLENIGKLPIEARDIDKALSLTFSDAKILSVEITNKNPSDIEVLTQHTQQVAQISHKLLNVGDSISFDILFDGKPEFPKPSIRISGISGITQFFPTTRGPVIHTTLIGMPRPVKYAMLAIVSVVAVTGTIFGGYFCVFLFHRIIRRRRPVTHESFEEGMIQSFTPQDFVAYTDREYLRNIGNPSSTIIASLEEQPSLNWVDAVHTLKKNVQNRVPPEVLGAYGLDPETAAQVIVAEIRSQLPDELALYVYRRMPPGADKEAREGVQQLDFTGQNIDEIFSQVRHIATNALPHAETVRVRIAVDPFEISGAILIFLAGISGILVLGGTWRTLLGL